MRDIRDKEINEFPDSKHEVTEDDDEGEFQCEDVPVDRREVSLSIPEPLVEAVRLTE